MQNKGVILENLNDMEKVSCFKKPFLCCGSSFKATKAYQYLKEKYNLTVWDKIRPNPRFEDMVAAAELFKRNNCDFMIGAGGGSPLDSAKMIKLLVTNDAKTALTEPMQANDIPFLAIPTTSGTGSEATRYSIFYVHENEKHSITHDDFLPDFVFLDAEFLKTVPLYQRRCTCMDALCHAIESYWNVKSNPKSREYAEKAIRLFVQNKAGYMANEPQANRGMLMASYYAGKAINITSTTSAHAMCYNITINCRTAHGHSVAVNLAEIWDYMNTHNEKVNDARGRDFVLKIFDELGMLLGGSNSADGARIFRALVDEFELYTPKADTAQVLSFAQSVNADRLLNNPTTLISDDVTEIYKRVFKING
ncbi:MAG: phosphonoacetaldehyde reductase [Eubacterium sp.]